MNANGVIDDYSNGVIDDYFSEVWSLLIFSWGALKQGLLARSLVISHQVQISFKICEDL